MRTFPGIIVLVCFATGCVTPHTSSTSNANFRQLDFASIHGANYCAAGGSHLEHWLNYNPKETERDLDYAKKIGIDQVRVFLSYPAWRTNKEAFNKNLVHLARACQERGIGLMPVVPSSREMLFEREPYELSRAWAKDLLDTIGREPALAAWDVFNEPDYPMTSTNYAARIAHARVMAGIFRELDTRRPRTPVTIGFAYEKSMEENADAVDVLAFHDYSPTREAIRSNITAAVAFAAKMHKPVINTEIGCVARANPYDVSIEEYSKSRVGFYMWELMITKSWGNVHGIFYPDGTVRDPSIPAAMLGLFRNRTTNVVEELPDREGWVTRTVTNGAAWLNESNAPYARGLDLAETAANLLEAGQLVAMHDLPSRRVAQLRDEPSDPAALRELLADLVHKLEPYRRAPRARQN